MWGACHLPLSHRLLWRCRILHGQPPLHHFHHGFYCAVHSVHNYSVENLWTPKPLHAPDILDVQIICILIITFASQDVEAEAYYDIDDV